MRVRGDADVGRSDHCGLIAGGAVVPHGDMILPTKLAGKDSNLSKHLVSSSYFGGVIDKPFGCKYSTAI